MVSPQVVQQALHISALICPTGAKPFPESKTQFLRLSNRPVKGRRVNHVARKSEKGRAGGEPAQPSKL